MAENDLYGIDLGSLAEAKELVEKRLDAIFEPHYSEYYGGDYYLFESADGERIILRRNIDIIDDEPAEPRYPDVNVLLYIEGTHRSNDLCSMLVYNGGLIKRLKHDGA